MTRSPTDFSKRPGLTAETLAFCLLLASSFQIMENLIPRIPIFPWLRFGLAYIVILPFLLRFGVLNTLGLFLCRNLITLVYGGQMFSSFFISSLSGVISLGAMGYLLEILYRKRVLGLLGVSVTLAASFNLIQLIVVNYFYIQHGDFLFQIGPMMLWSVLSGGVIAFLVSGGGSVLSGIFERESGYALKPSTEAKRVHSWGFWVTGMMALTAFVALFVFKSIYAQVALLVAGLLITRFRYLKTVFYAWPFYVYIVWLHLFRTDGVFIYMDWITREGLENFIFYATRTTNVIVFGQILSRFVPALWKKSTGNLYARGIGFALPLLPALFGISLSLGKEILKRIRKREFEGLLNSTIERLERELMNLSVSKE